MRLLSLGHLSFRIWSKQLGVITHRLRRQIAEKCPLIFSSSINPLDTYFVNQSHNPGKLTFVNASFWEKRTAIHKPRRPFNFDLKTYPSRTILREVSRVSSLILRAKPWLAKKVLRHGNRFAARVRRRYFFGGREATTGNASSVRRLRQHAFSVYILWLVWLFHQLVYSDSSTPLQQYSYLCSISF